MTRHASSGVIRPTFGRAAARPRPDGPATVTRLPGTTRNASPEPTRSPERDLAPAAPPSAASSAGAPPLVVQNKEAVKSALMERLDLEKASRLSVEDLTWQVNELVAEILIECNVALNAAERRALVAILVDDMVGLGPLEPLLADDAVTDILVNGADRVYVERDGRLRRTDVRFRDDRQVMDVARRIASRAGRRIDESTPLVDARLADGSRVNIIIPPLAIDGPSISIRKFGRRTFTLRDMARQGNMSREMAAVLMIAGRARVNILVSGGTGSGKTTLLNAISEVIDADERVVTIEDAAELRLQQPHVVRLETRPPNIEGRGEVRMRQLLRNALRMRPDRIIVGEVRGDEVVDMLQAMNTGHDGSLGTIHANSPRDALIRLENLFAMAGLRFPVAAARAQIASAVDLIVQVSRMRDGTRRVTHITEITGTEGETILTQDLFTFVYEGEDADGAIRGRFVGTGIRPRFAAKAKYFGLEGRLMQAIQGHADATAA